MTVINLYRMRRMIRETQKLAWKIERERSYAARSAAPLSQIPWGQGNRSRVEEGAIRIADLKDVYREVLAELEEMRQALDPLIDTLKNADDRAVMRLRYIKGYDPEDVAEAIFRTDRMVYYILSRSEKELIKRFPDNFSVFQ